jgi:SET domain-containing protein
MVRLRLDFCLLCSPCSRRLRLCFHYRLTFIWPFHIHFQLSTINCNPSPNNSKCADAIVDATVRGNIARYINHCCDPNCDSRVISVNESGTSSAPQFAADSGDGSGGGLIDPMQQKIVIIARRPIEAGQEITYGTCFDASQIHFYHRASLLARIRFSICTWLLPFSRSADYKFPIEAEKISCSCGALNCIGRMN